MTDSTTSKPQTARNSQPDDDSGTSSNSPDNSELPTTAVERSSNQKSGYTRNTARQSLGEQLSDIWAARPVMINLAGRDLKIRHRGTVLGLIWSLATPLAMVATYAFIFSVVFKPNIPNSQYPFVLHLFSGMVLWSLFANSVTGATGSILNSSYIINKMYIPRIVLPIVSVLSALVTFAFEFLVLLIFCVAFGRFPWWTYVMVPVVVAEVFLLALGIGILLSAASVFLKDIPHLVTIGLQMMFFGTPIVYSLTQFNDQSRILQVMRLNPMYHCVNAFRNCLLDRQMPTAENLIVPLVFATILIGIGYNFFHRVEKQFAERI